MAENPGCWKFITMSSASDHSTQVMTSQDFRDWETNNLPGQEARPWHKLPAHRTVTQVHLACGPTPHSSRLPLKSHYTHALRSHRHSHVPSSSPPNLSRAARITHIQPDLCRNHLSHEDSSMLGIMKVLEEDDKVSCYDLASLDKLASLTSLTDERPNRLSEDYHQNVIWPWLSSRSVDSYEAHRRAIAWVSCFT